ncbi:MAG: ankyrin repeat domain-containing protein [Alphaproteobacteria bacterium]
MTLAEKFTRFAKRQYLWYLTPVKYNFMESLSKGDLDAVKKTVELFPEAIHWKGGWTFHGTWDDNTALSTAFWGRNCASGNVGMMNFLIDLGADVNLRDKYGNTVLHRAAGSTDKEAIAALVLRGADPGIRSNGGKTVRDILASVSDKARGAACLQAIEESLQAREKLCTAQTIASCTDGTQRAVPVRNRPLELKKSKITY